MQLERSGREQKELGAGLEADLEAVNEKFSKLQQDHETQMSLYQQLEMELARKSSELSEKEDIEIQVRSEILMQKKEIDNLGKKISALESLKTELEHDKEKLKTDIASKNKEVEELQHQALVTKKDLNILENAKEGVEMKLERSAQTIKNEAFKVNSEIQFTPILVLAGQVSGKRKRRAAVAGVAVGRHCGAAAEVHL